MSRFVVYLGGILMFKVDWGLGFMIFIVDFIFFIIFGCF